MEPATKPNSMWVQNVIVFSGGCGAPFYERNLVGAHRDFKKGRFQDPGICVYILGLDLLVRWLDKNHKHIPGEIHADDFPWDRVGSNP